MSHRTKYPSIHPHHHEPHSTHQGPSRQPRRKGNSPPQLYRHRRYPDSAASQTVPKDVTTPRTRSSPYPVPPSTRFPFSRAATFLPAQSALGLLVLSRLSGRPFLASPPALPDAPLRYAFSCSDSRWNKSPERKARPDLRCTMSMSRSCHNSHSHKRYPLVVYSTDLGDTVLHCSSVYTRALADPAV